MHRVTPSKNEWLRLKNLLTIPVQAIRFGQEMQRAVIWIAL